MISLHKNIKEKWKENETKIKIVLYGIVGLLLLSFIIRIKKKITSQITIIKIDKRCKNIPSNETIFVAITCSKGQLKETVRCVEDLFNSCACPKRIFVGICFTLKNSDESEEKIKGEREEEKKERRRMEIRRILNEI